MPNQAGFGNDPILLTRHGRSVAAIISIPDLELLLRMKFRRTAARKRELTRDPTKIGAETARRVRNEIFYG